jgi:flagellar FliJ protein
MPEARQLTFLEKLAAEKSDAQGLQLAKARRALAASEDQLQQLQRYESGYNTQLGQKLEAEMAIDALRGHHRFMQNIAHAVRQQELEVARRRAYADAIARVWQETERRRQGFRVMASKLGAAAQRAETRRQQKSNDEFSARKLLQTNVGF